MRTIVLQPISSNHTRAVETRQNKYVRSGPAIKTIPTDARKLLLFVALFAMLMSVAPPSNGQVNPAIMQQIQTMTVAHDGMLNSNAELAAIKASIVNGQEPWSTAYARLLRYAVLPYTPHPYAIVDKTDGVSEPALMNDAMAAYAQALQWQLSGNSAYADSAVNILNSWSYTLTGFKGINWVLDAGWSGTIFATAAEMIRETYPSGWASTDQAQFTKMCNTVYLPILNLRYGYGNREFSYISAMMAIGVFNNDRAAIAQAAYHYMSYIQNYVYMARDGAQPIKANYWVTEPTLDEYYTYHSDIFPDKSTDWLYANNNPYGLPDDKTGMTTNTVAQDYNETGGTVGYFQGQSAETYRDLGHVENSIAAISDTLEIARQQGIDLYAISPDRLVDFLETNASFRLGASSPISGYTINSSNDLSTTYETIYNHLVNVDGYSMPNTNAIIPAIRQALAWRTTPAPNGVSATGLSAAANWFGGWETLTHGSLTTYSGSADFVISGAPGSQTVTAGSDTSYTATVTAIGGFSGTTSFSVSGLPDGVTGSFSSLSVDGSGSSTLSISTSATTPSGSYPLVITATSGNLVHSSTVTLVVNASGYDALPSPWVSQDIGTVGFPGSATYVSPTFTVTGSGANIWGTADAFQFAYQPCSGDCNIIARVVTQQAINKYSIAGVMIRETLAPNSAYALTLVTPSGLYFQERTTTGASAKTIAGPLTGSAPYWVRVARSENIFTSYASPDGTTWTQIGSPQSITMATSVSVGLAVSPHDNTKTSTATFDNVSAGGQQSSITLSSSSDTPPLGSAVTLTATVTGGGQTPTGNVVFSLASAALCTTTLDVNGVATCNYTPSTFGTLTITAQYQGSMVYRAANASTTLDVYNGAVTLDISNTQLVYPGAANATACITSAGNTAATGSVRIFDGASLLNTQTAQGNGCAYWYISPGLSAGAHSLVAVYSGDTNNSGGPSAPITVIVDPVPVNMSVSCWNPSFAYGADYQCTVNASSNAGEAQGNITYSVDGGSAMRVPLNGGSVQFSVVKPTVGTHQVVASYSQQTNYAAAGAQTESFSVTPASVNIALIPSTYYTTAGMNLTLVSSVNSPSAGPPNATGVVAFYDGSTLLGSVPVDSSGQASYATVNLAVGSHTITATYAGGTNYASGSSTATITVAQ